VVRKIIVEVSRRVIRMWRVVWGMRGRGKAMYFELVDGAWSCTPEAVSSGLD
jgi:hypothetical protein